MGNLRLHPTVRFLLLILLAVAVPAFTATRLGTPAGAVPESATLFLLGAGLTLIGLAARRRVRAQKKA